MASIARCARFAAPATARLAPRAAAPVKFAFRGFSTSRLSLARRYTKDHEWIDISADRKTGVVGISEYAAEALGDVVYVELPESSDFIDQGDTMGAVESVKSASDINAPVRLRITSVNRGLEEKPSTINQVPEDDSHGGGWIAKVDIDEEGAQQFDALMDAEAYKTFVSEEEH
jgi:glycine cleavage system H protein